MALVHEPAKVAMVVMISPVSPQAADVDGGVSVRAVHDRQHHLPVADAEGRVGARRRVGAHARRSSTAARSSRRAGGGLDVAPNSPCSMPWTISTDPGADARRG